jgi:hypothetical protein
MGNQVLIAIRHDIDRSSIPVFSEQDDMGLHEGDRIPKNFELNNSIIVSHYHHSGDKVCLIVKNDLMASVSSFLDIFRQSEKGLKVDAIKNIISEYRKCHFFSKILKSKKTPVAEAGGGVKVSLFGYMTDSTHEMPENSFELMVKEMDSMPSLTNGTTSVRGWKDHIGSTPIVKIGTIDSDQFAIVELYGNLFSVITEQRHYMEPLVKSENFKEEAADFKIKLLKSLGYDVTV